MSLDIFDQFASDETLELNGTWFPLGNGAELLVARSGNDNYVRLAAKEYEKNRVALDLNDDAARELSKQITIDAVAQSLLLGWKNLTYKKQPIEYSVENAKKLLAHREFRQQVFKFADDASAFKLKEEKEQGEA